MCLEQFPVERAGNLAVLSLPDEVDITTADLLRDTLMSAVDQGAATVIVDMSLTMFCDSAALSALIVAHRHARAAGGELGLVAVGPTVLRVMKITGVDRLIPSYPTISAAKAGIGQPEPEVVAD